MSIFFGDREMGEMYIGQNKVGEVYVGSELVYQGKGAPIPFRYINSGVGGTIYMRLSTAYFLTDSGVDIFVPSPNIVYRSGTSWYGFGSLDRQGSNSFNLNTTYEGVRYIYLGDTTNTSIRLSETTYGGGVEAIHLGGGLFEVPAVDI